MNSGLALSRTAWAWLVPIVLCALPEQAHAGQRYAVVIGNNLGRSQEQRLHYAQRDAERFVSVLRRHGSLPAENTVLLLGESATAIRRALLEVNARIRAAQSDASVHSTLLVYYSGHADAEGLHPGKNTLPYEELRAMLRGSSATVRVLVLDGCRSGELTHVKGGTPGPEFEIKADVNPDVEGVVMISSSAAGEDSHESERLGASFFSHHLSNALLGAGDRNSDGAVTLSEAYTYAYDNTLRASGRTLKLQHPTYSYDLKGRGELVLTRLPRDRATTASLQFEEPGLYLVLDGRNGNHVVAELQVSRPKVRFALSPGKYSVQRREADHYRHYEVAMKAGERLSLGEVEYRSVRYARLVRKGSGERRAAHGIFALAGGRGPILAGLGPSLSLGAAYDLDLALINLEVRGRVSTSGSRALAGPTEAVHDEIAMGVVVRYFVDLSWISLAAGLLVEGIYHHQTLVQVVAAEPRASYGLAFGAVFTAQRELVGPLALRIEGGPLTHVLRQAIVVAGSDVGTETVTPVTGWGSVGLGWQF